MTELTRFERRGEVDRLILNSPHKRNALSAQMIEELLAGLAGSRGRVLVIGHEGDAFCAGVDLRERAAMAADQESQTALLTQLVKALLDVPHPVICEVNGAVRGGGMALVACADIVVAGPSASFAFSEVRVGVVPAIVGVLAVQKASAGSLAAPLLTGSEISLENALSAGLVHSISDDPAAAVGRYSSAFLKSGPNAVAGTKALLRRASWARPIDELLNYAAAVSAQQFASPEAAEGIAAFLERRTPAWAAANRDP
jgi:enoyl-CoA hydratase/carnithine racemase